MNMLQTKKEELKKQGKKGFTLMELLIVVAIIAVLVAIAIPLFTNQLEKAREATDLANIRSAYAVASTELLTDTDQPNSGNTKVGVAVTPALESTGKFDHSGDADIIIGGINMKNQTVADGGGTVTVTVSADGTVTLSGAISATSATTTN